MGLILFYIIIHDVFDTLFIFTRFSGNVYRDFINKIITIYNIGFSSHNHASTRSIRKRDAYV